MEIVKERGHTFTSEDFIRYIDKFIVSDNNVVCFETDGEYVRNLQAIKEDEEALKKVGNDLDDFLFTSGGESDGEGKGGDRKSQLNKFLRAVRSSNLSNKDKEGGANSNSSPSPETKAIQKQQTIKQ